MVISLISKSNHAVARLWGVSVFVLSIIGSTTLTADETINFNRDIRPILSDKCFSCHGLDKNARKADLRLDQRESAVETKAIVPGRPGESSLIERIFSDDRDAVMPPPRSNKTLTASEKNLLKRWIEQRAEYQPHWSFIPIPKHIDVPKPDDPEGWVRTPIDAFVLARLRKNGLSPATEATREKWLRRASFDLTGLPPSISDLDTFLSDTSAEAYARAADRMLDSSSFGERMANEWLDAARYADTFGYQSDREMHVWPWRDWVIRAFNENLPYDQFISWQTAGDLLPDATRDQQLATAFNRLHRQTNEGGSTEEEFRQAYITDRVVTNGTAFLGMTFECARCHNHKYDPITQADFYRLAAFFANIDEHGLYSHFTETAPTPAIPLYEGDQQAQHRELIDRIHEKQFELIQIREGARKRFQDHPLSKSDFHDEETIFELMTSLTGVTPVPKIHQTFENVKISGENKLVPGIDGQAIDFSGDDAFACPQSGQYGRNTPFSISLWLKPAEHKPRIVICHQSVAAEDAAFRGYSLILENGQPQFSLIHFWPGDAIRVQSRDILPLNEWTHIAVNYDGSSRASGVSLYINGKLVETQVVRDQLTRDIKYRKEWGDSNSNGVELSLGARFRDSGFRGGAIDELFVFDQQLSALEIGKLYLEQNSLASANRTQQPIFPEPVIFEHFLFRIDEPYRQAMRDLQALCTAENELITQVRQIMALKDALVPRPTYVLRRGAYDAPGELVTADTPSSILPFPTELPRNRLGLAEWLIDQRNPLTSRVAVNRFWCLLFGRGLVASVEDFGGQGQLPSHPELIDWLARDFMDHGWNVKELCKQIILSATYRQSSIPRNTGLFLDDPDNVLLARGTRYRLTAEQLRDNALTVSGLLVEKLGGPSVMPYQPVGLWEESGTGKSYRQAKGEGLYRRSLYTFWRRTSPPPSMTTFDATSREVCTARRERTATPLQSLVLMNDPQYVEAARVLSEKLIEQTAERLDSRIQRLFRLLTSRNPTDQELAILTKLFDEQRLHFESVPDEAKSLIAIGDSRNDAGLEPAEVAALTIVIKTVMNFDECVTKR